MSRDPREDANTAAELLKLGDAVDWRRGRSPIGVDRDTDPQSVEQDGPPRRRVTS